ncbi:MAG TPA: hypothetical protein VFR95_06775 [Gemmatimonadaceae bacterium]|nr:hypothetical protein [Gemmatimonadaceae bacterium]
MSTARRALLALAVMTVAATAACARNPEPRADSESAAGADSGASSSLTEVKGRVMNGGTDRSPITSLVSDDGSATRLGGALLDELRALSGAELSVRGVMSSGGAGRSLDVTEYEVLAIDGQRPHVGILLARDGELWLASSDTLRLVPALDALRERVGAKVWVVGTRDAAAGELRVQSYGVIAPAR